MPSVALKLLADSLVLSHLSYALPVWSPIIAKTALNRPQCQQNWTVHIGRI